MRIDRLKNIQTTLSRFLWAFAPCFYLFTLFNQDKYCIQVKFLVVIILLQDLYKKKTCGKRLWWSHSKLLNSSVWCSNTLRIYLSKFFKLYRKSTEQLAVKIMYLTSKFLQNRATNNSWISLGTVNKFIHLGGRNDWG